VDDKAPRRALLLLAVLVLAMGVTAVLQKAFVPAFGLDLAGGTTVTLSPVTPDGGSPSQESLDRAVAIIRARVNGTGITDAEVAKANDTIVVSIPGAGRPEAIKLISTTAELRMRPVLAVAPARPGPGPLPPPAPTAAAGQGPLPTAAPTPAAQAAGARERAEPGRGSPAASPSPTPTGADPLAGQDLTGIDPALLDRFRTLDCTARNRGQGTQDDPDRQIVACSADGSLRYILDKAAVQGTEIAGATAGADRTIGEWAVQVSFKPRGAAQLAEVTRRISGLPAPRNRLASVLDGVVIVAPAIKEAIPGGTARIFGDLTQRSATELAEQLKYGALPLTFRTASVVSVSSTLGQDQLRGGLLAGALGLLLVVPYLLGYYRGLGLIGVASLGVAGVITYLAVALLSHNAGFRLSLPHLIGLVVSIGVTADSFIVFFERIRDELRRGRRALRPAVEVAWRRARRTILIADTVMFIAAVVLYVLAVGGVAGFAFAMGLTTLIDLIVVVLFTKPVTSLAARLGFFARGHRLSGLDPGRLGPVPGAAGRAVGEA